jgi:hypothetical protein
MQSPSTAKRVVCVFIALVCCLILAVQWIVILNRPKPAPINPAVIQEFFERNRSQGFGGAQDMSPRPWGEMGVGDFFRSR